MKKQYMYLFMLDFKMANDSQVIIETPRKQNDIQEKIPPENAVENPVEVIHKYISA